VNAKVINGVGTKPDFARCRLVNRLDADTGEVVGKNVLPMSQAARELPGDRFQLVGITFDGPNNLDAEELDKFSRVFMRHFAGCSPAAWKALPSIMRLSGLPAFLAQPPPILS
jgi:hypothetical protein